VKLFTILISFLVLVSSSGAVTISNTDNLKNFGNAIGFKNGGTIQAADLYATDDFKAGDDAEIGGDLAVTGAISAGLGTISSGVYDGDFRLAANHSFYSTTGSGAIDWSNATGIFKSPTGVNTLGGNTVITGTKTFRVNGGASTFGSSVTAASAVINGTADINGATTTAAITVDSGSIVTADQYKRRTVTNSTNFTITDGGADVYLVGNGTGVNTQTVTFPTAADNKGRIITIIVATDPLSNTVILDGEGAETIDTAATKTTTDAVGSMYHLICNGYAWIKITSLGTWS
jgi:hypothetical protein